MSVYTVIAVMATLFALRFIIPLAISLGICRGMCWFIEQSEA